MADRRSTVGSVVSALLSLDLSLEHINQSHHVTFLQGLLGRGRGFVRLMYNCFYTTQHAMRHQNISDASFLRSCCFVVFGRSVFNRHTASTCTCRSNFGYACSGKRILIISGLLWCAGRWPARGMKNEQQLQVLRS